MGVGSKGAGNLTWVFWGCHSAAEFPSGSLELGLLGLDSLGLALWSCLTFGWDSSRVNIAVSRIL